MNTFDEREKGFERKFVNDEEQEFRAVARRDRMLGEWAAALMGLEDAGAYARALVKSDLEHCGDEDVLRKLIDDLAGSGVAIQEAVVRAKMDEFLAIARGQIRSGA